MSGFRPPGLGGAGLTPEQESTLEHFEYNPTTNMLEGDRSIQTILSSLLLGTQHRMSSGGENIFFTNLSSQVDWFPPWTGIKDQEVLANQDVTGLIPVSTRVHSDDLLFLEANGPEDTSGAVSYEGTNIVPSNVSVFGVKFTIEEPMVPADWLFYEVFIGTDDTGQLMFQQTRSALTLSAGDTLPWFFTNPLEGRTGLPIYTRLSIAKGNQDAARTVLQVRRSSTMPTRHWVESSFRSWTDEDMALKSDILPPLTDAEIKTQYENNADTNAFTDAEKSKLGSLTGGRYLGVFADLTALQTAHPTAVSGDTATVTSPDGNLFYWNGAAWADSGTGFAGDMLKAVYDPTAKNASAFSMGNMDETATKKILTDTERTKLSGIEALAEVNNISDVDATDLTDGGETTLHTHQASPLPTLTRTTNANVDSFDVTSLAPDGILFLDMASNRDVKSFLGGVDGQRITISNLTVNNVKLKHQNGIDEQFRTEGASDQTVGAYGGFTVVYHAASGFWYATGMN